MTFLENIDFYNHDGVNRGMINDFMRNQFYENIFVNNVKDQHCVDIGFGTGLLSIIALKHGAKTVTAYEVNQARYHLGLSIINQLELDDRICLINKNFTQQDFDHHSEITTVFSETVNGNLWQEGLINSLPRKKGLNFLPGEYFLEIYACNIPEIFAQGLVNFYENQGFSPGVDIDSKFVNLVNMLGFPNHQPKFLQPLEELTVVNSGQDTEWGWIPYMRLCVNNGVLVSGYSLDANQQTINFVNGSTESVDFQSTHIECQITNDWHTQCILLIPRVGMRHADHTLYLDTGHWGPTQFPVILNKSQKNISVKHCLRSGDIMFTLV